jgi:mono/diheme cytochrome c family protein
MTDQANPANVYLSDAAALAEGEALYRGRCVGCHKAGGGSGPNLFRTALTPRKFVDEVVNGRNGMPAFRGLLDEQQILKVHAFVASRDQL